MDIHANRKAVQELNSLYAEMNGYKIEPPKEKLKTDRNMFNIPKSEQDAARERIKAKTAAKRAKMSEGDAADEASMKKFQALQKNVDQKRKLNIRGNDSAEQKARLEKKRGMKLDDHPQFKKEEVEVEEGYDEPKMHSAVKRVMTTQPAAKGRAASRLHSKYSMRSKGNVAGETDGPGPNAPKRSGRKGRGSETDRGSGNAAKRRMSTEALDPVGKEDGDVNNDGKKDSTDSYLMNRRKAIGKAMGKKMKKEEVEAVAEGDGDPCWDTHKQVGMKKKGGRMVPNCVPKTRKESFSDWRSELVEVIDKEEQDKQIKEKNVKNKVTIDPELKLEQVAEELGGELLEWIELDEASYEEIAAKMKAKKKADDRMTVTNADKKANTPAYQKFKAGDKRYKAADHMGEDADLDKMQKDADANRARAAKLKDRNVTRGSASLAAAKVADDVKKAAKTGPQQHKGTRTGVKRIEKPKPTHTKTGAMRVEGLSVDDQMRISRDAAKDRNPKPDHKAIRGKMLKKPLPKDTRTDAQKMTDATGPRPGSRYRGD